MNLRNYYNLPKCSCIEISYSVCEDDSSVCYIIFNIYEEFTKPLFSKCSIWHEYMKNECSTSEASECTDLYIPWSASKYHY